MTDVQWAYALRSWSERYDPAAGGAWRDCTQSSVLFLLVAAGLPASKFVLGVRSWQERERFEDAEGIPESEQEQGLVGYHLCDVASQKLYGVVTHDATEAQLPTLLATTGVAVALTGQGAGLPSGVTVRHSVPVVPIDGGQVLVFDPTAPNASVGAVASVPSILAWHARLNTDIRLIHRDELKEIDMLDVTFAPGQVGVLTIDDLGNTRGLLLGTTGTVVLPKTLRAVSGLYVKVRSEAAYLASVDGAPVAILAHNVTSFVPDAVPASSGLAHWTLTDGVLSVTSA